MDERYRVEVGGASEIHIWLNKQAAEGYRLVAMSSAFADGRMMLSVVVEKETSPLRRMSKVT